MGLGLLSKLLRGAGPAGQQVGKAQSGRNGKELRGGEASGMLDHHELRWNDRMRQTLEPPMTPQEQADDESWWYGWSNWWGR
jgi:hypothetical protein